MNILRRSSSSSLSTISHHQSSQSLTMKHRMKQNQTGRSILDLDMEENRKRSKNKNKDQVKRLNNNNINKVAPLIDVQTLIKKNRLTLHFEERSKSQLPDISTFKKAQKLLMSPFHYKKYQELIESEGRHQSTIQQVEREINAYRAKISIAKSSNVVFRQSLDVPRVSVKQVGQLIVNNEFKLRKAKSQSLGFQLAFLNKSKGPKVTKRHSKIKDNWKLKDFYDSIVQDLDEKGIKLIKEREKLVSKLKHINSYCTDIESDACLANSINVFSQFCKKVNDKLVKKHRKIDKICYFRY